MCRIMYRIMQGFPGNAGKPIPAADDSQSTASTHLGSQRFPRLSIALVANWKRPLNYCTRFCAQCMSVNQFLKTFCNNKTKLTRRNSTSVVFLSAARYINPLRLSAPSFRKQKLDRHITIQASTFYCKFK